MIKGKKLRKKTLIILSTISLFTNTISADNLKELEQNSLSLWSGFKCSMLYSKNKQPEDSKRAFKFAYNSGIVLIDKFKNNEINQEEFTKIMPKELRKNLSGPTSSFILGRIWEATSKHTFKDIHKKDGEFLSEDEQLILTKQKIEEYNCQSLGK